MYAWIGVAFVDLNTIQSRVAFVADTSVLIDLVDTDTISARIRAAFVHFRRASCVDKTSVAIASVRVEIVNTGAVYTRT